VITVTKLMLLKSMFKVPVSISLCGPESSFLGECGSGSSFENECGSGSWIYVKSKNFVKFKK
jgi:hypothetical protein